MNTIDIHTHMFNLKYLPVAGILRRFTNNVLPMSLAMGAERYLVKHTRSDYDVQQEALISDNDHQIPILQQLQQAGVIQVTQFKISTNLLELVQSSEENTILEMMSLALPSDQHDELIQQAITDFQHMMLIETSRTFNSSSPALLFTHENNHLKSLGEFFDIFWRMIEYIMNMVKKIMSTIELPGNYIKWFRFMMNSESTIYKQIKSDSKGVAKHLALMMDVDAFFIDDKTGYEHKSHFDFYPNQIDNMLDVSKKHGEIVVFSAFNPARPNWKTIIDYAISKGCGGIKFYPPLGYLPFYTEEEANENFLFKNVNDFFDYTNDKRFPIFTHCTNTGFQARPFEHSGYKANPVKWKKLLDKHRDLKICFGHAGGGAGWFNDHREGDFTKASEVKAELIHDKKSDQQANWNQSYAAYVFKLCVECENVYCDIAYLEEMMDDDGDDTRRRNNFKKRLLTLFNSEPKFATRVIYGSDWHMLFQESINAVYYDNYVDFFKSSDFDEYRENIFEKNAERYLSIPNA